MLRPQKQTRRHRVIAEMNVVPYVDVMLVLLVIFMVTTPLLTQGVDVALPQASAEMLSADEQMPLVVSVDADGAYYLNVASDPQAVLTPEDLLYRIAAALSLDPTRQVLVKGDRQAHYGQVVQAMVLLQQAGAATVGLMTEEA